MANRYYKGYHNLRTTRAPSAGYKEFTASRAFGTEGQHTATHSSAVVKKGRRCVSSIERAQYPVTRSSNSCSHRRVMLLVPTIAACGLVLVKELLRALGKQLA